MVMLQTLSSGTPHGQVHTSAGLKSHFQPKSPISKVPPSTKTISSSDRTTTRSTSSRLSCARFGYCASIRAAISPTFSGESFWLSGRLAELQAAAAAQPTSKASVRIMFIAFVLETAHQKGSRLTRSPRGKGQHGSELERSEEHTSELQSRENLVCRLLLE